MRYFNRESGIAAMLLGVVLLFISHTHSIAKEEKKPVVITADEMLMQLRDMGGISTDAKFITLMKALGMPDELYAPAKMREMLTSLPVVKMGMGVGYVQSIGRLSFIWSTGDCYMSGYREQVLQRILTLLKKFGFREDTSSQRPADMSVYTLEEGGLIHTVAIGRPEEKMMNNQPLCYTKIVWKVEVSSITSLPTVARFLSIFSFMKDRRIEEAVYKELGPLEVEMLTRGSTGGESFDWDATVLPTEKMKKGALYSQLKTLIESLGYLPEAYDGEVETFSRKSTKSYATLNKVAGSEKVHLRFLPGK